MSGLSGHTLVARFETLLQSSPDTLAFAFHGPEKGEADSCSRAELWAAASAIARRIMPVGPGRHVMVVMPLGKRLVAAHFGAQMAGCRASIFTHPSAKLSQEVYRANLKNALAMLHPDVLVTTSAFTGDLQHAIGAGIRVVVIDGEPDDAGPTPDAWRNYDGDATAIIQYSSGSTGLQKGVALSHRMALGQIDAYARVIQLDPASDHICSWLPLYHDMGLFTAYLMPLVTGTPTSMIDPFRWIQDPLSLLHIIGRMRGTLCWQPNFAFNVLAMRAAGLSRGSFDLSTMRGFTNCSEPVFPQTIEHFVSAMEPQGLRPKSSWVCYAMAENSFAVTACGGDGTQYRQISIDPHRYRQGHVVTARGGSVAMALASCGRPMEGCEVRIVDPDNRALLDGDRVGEVAIRSPFLFREYLNNTEATSACRDADGWYFTGDLGFVSGGDLFISGRKKDLIIVAGRNFYPQDLECVASSVAGVIPGRVVALGDRDDLAGTERVIVIVESKITDPAERKAISDNIRKRIFEDLDCPVGDVAVMQARWLVKTSSGKIARRKNLRRYHQWRDASKRRAGASADENGSRARSATAGEVVAWGLAWAMAAYAYLIFYVIDRNASWNIYAGF